jgi:hypothetical protein
MGSGFYIGSTSDFNQSRVDVGRNADGRLEVFAVRNDGRLLHAYQISAGAGWSSFYDTGFSTSGKPAVGRNQDGRLELVATSSGRLYHQFQVAPNVGWSSWYAFPDNAWTARTDVPPAIASNHDGRLEIFIADITTACPVHLWQLAPNSGWSGFAKF